MKSNDAFLSDFARSQAIVNAVALWIRDRGRRTFLNPVEIRPDAASRHQYSDRGDIVILRDGLPHRIEVKHRADLHFTCRANYPYATLFVDEAYKLRPDRTGVDPLEAYVIVAKDREHLAIVTPESRPHWVESTRMDRKQNRICTFVECPVAHAHFRRMTPRQQAAA